MNMNGWRPVRGFEKLFSVSDEGQVVRTSLSWQGHRRRPIWRPLRPDTKPNGYLAIYLQEEGGDRKRCYVHRLVYEAFRGQIPSGLEINHKDGNRANNRLSNLELVTRSENMLHGMAVMGRKNNPARGEAHYLAKLTEADILIILDLLKRHVSHRSIAKQFGVSKTAIRAIAVGKSWTHITRLTGPEGSQNTQ